MRSIWKVWFSKRRKIYFRIASKFRTTPWKVYRLGHGGMSKNKKDIKILEELQGYGVIFSVYLWCFHHIKVKKYSLLQV